MGANIQRFGGIMSGQMKKTAGAASGTTIEMGRIGAGLSLTTDTIKTPIPYGDYMVNLFLTHDTYRTSEETHEHSGGWHEGHEEGDGKHGHADGEHDHQLPEVFRGLQVGDRVLVAWCGYEPVVIAIIVSV